MATRHYRYSSGEVLSFQRDIFEDWPDVPPRRRGWIKRRKSPLPAYNPISGQHYRDFKIDTDEIMAELGAAEARARRAGSYSENRVTLYKYLGRAYQQKQVEWARELEGDGIGRATYGIDYRNGGETVDDWQYSPAFTWLADVVGKRDARVAELDSHYYDVAEDHTAMLAFMWIVDTIQRSDMDADDVDTTEQLWPIYGEWYRHDGNPASLVTAIGELHGWSIDNSSDQPYYDRLAAILGYARVDYNDFPYVEGQEKVTDTEDDMIHFAMWAHDQAGDKWYEDVDILWPAYVATGGYVGDMATAEAWDALYDDEIPPNVMREIEEAEEAAMIEELDEDVPF